MNKLRSISLSFALALAIFSTFATCKEQTYLLEKAIDKTTYEQSIDGNNKPPLYWSIYSYSLKQDRRGIPKEEADFKLDQWITVLDWMQTNFLPYGYDMVCSDGWSIFNCEGNSVYTTHLTDVSIQDLVSEARKRGLKVGIYDNPMWIHCDESLKIPGTDIQVGTLKYNEQQDPVVNPGAKDKWHKWALATHQGAKEWVDGFFRHYAELGVSMLRIDFLSWYENGSGRIDGITGPGYGRENYTLCLKYIAESANKYGIFTSLVMPHMFNDGELEKECGDMVRIVGDTWDGGWAFTSSQHRGKGYNDWPNCENQFDGFTYWNHLTGKDKIIPDGDFTVIKSYTNDAEKEFVISLQLIAGGPVAISDTPWLIDNHDMKFYLNYELLELNKDHFVGKPLDDSLDSEGSKIWHGEMSNGDHIVAFFNRDDIEKSFNINMQDLGLNGPKHIRDLWRHSDEGNSEVLTATVPAHGCKVMRLSAPKQSQLYVLGQRQTINGHEINDWNINQPLVVDASDGYFTLECSYLRALTMSTSKSTNWGEFNAAAVGPEGFELIPGTESDPHYRVPLSVLGKEVKAVKSAFNIAPPYPGAYTIRIKDDLSTIEYITAPRRVAVCGTFNNFSTDNGTWEMTSDDNISYTFICDDEHQIKAGERIRLFANSNWTYSWMYMTGESTEGAEITLGNDSQEWSFIGTGLSDGSVFAKDFTGTITAVIPAGDIYAENFYQGTKAQVTCTPFTVTGIVEAVEDCDTNATVEYYTLQGIRINAPVEGLYIKRQGNKVSKILIK